MLFSHVREDGTALFFYPERDHRSVHVTGSFCGWRAPGEPLRRVEHGWIAEVGPVPPGDIEYKLVVDGRWIADPINPARRPDGLGGENSLLHRGDRRGAVHHLEFQSPALGEKRGYVVYLPPAYAATNRRFPVLYLLHGALDWEKTWLDKGNLVETMDRLRAEGSIGDMIVVMPRDSGDLYRGDGRAADYLARDVVGHIDYEFRTLADPRHRGLDGLSTGGFTSVVLGASRPHVWRSIGSLSGSHDDRTFDTLRAQAGAMRAAGQRYRIFCGLEEPHVETSRAVARELMRAGIDAELAEAHGIHDWPLWREALPGELRFHWASIRP
ncbi:MAG: alpha/beta hydrolase-fold protein [Minicystis sp.]